MPRSPLARSRGRRSRHGRAQGRKKIVRYAVVGLGYIAQVAVLPAFAHARRNSRLVALVSDDPRKRAALARRYGVSKVYDYAGYAECLKDPEVDAVYIALPNHLHRDYAIAAARAGKHILCEKPLAPDEKDCQAMIAAADRADVRLMTAYRLHFEKTNLEAGEIVRSGKLGRPRIFQALFTMNVEAGNIRLGPTALGGGPIYDIGIYCINAARTIFRAEPTEAFAFSAASQDPRFRKSPEMMSCILRFPGERLASFTCSLGASDTGWLQVVGTRGDLRLDPAFEYSHELVHRLTVDGKTRKTRFSKRDQFAPELLHFSDMVLSRRHPVPSGREGLADVRVIRALLKSSESGRPVDLAPFERRRRPSRKLAIHRPPVRKPRLIHAAPPSAA